MSNPEYKPLKNIYSRKRKEFNRPAVIELAAGSVVRRSVDMTLFKPMLVFPESDTFRPYWFAFHDFSTPSEKLLAPPNTPARIALTKGEIFLLILKQSLGRK